MVEFDDVLAHARQLSPKDQGRLIEALWDAIPDEADLLLHPEWASELEKRVAGLQSDSKSAIPWTQIREEALRRLRNGTKS